MEKIKIDSIWEYKGKLVKISKITKNYVSYIFCDKSSFGAGAVDKEYFTKTIKKKGC